MYPPTESSNTNIRLSSPLSVKDIQIQLQKILISPEFHATKQQRKLLEFVVSETFGGREQEIKGFAIATRVFDRKDDFDQSIDPIVSIQANKLRRALERYYLTAGKKDLVHIDIPKGTYVPTFQLRKDLDSNKPSQQISTFDVSLGESWPTVLIKPFKNLTKVHDSDYLGIGFAIELATEITRFQEIRVLVQGPEGQGKKATDLPAHFLVQGSIRKDMTRIKVTVNLMDTKTSKQIWSDAYQSDLDAAQLIAFQEEVARIVAAEVTGERGVIARTLSLESRNKPTSELKTYEAILKYYKYDMTLTPESFIQALKALEHASVNEPECGQVWSHLGRLYGNLYSLGYPGYENPLEKAIQFTEKGVQLNPDNQRARASLALVRMFSNEISAALSETEKALALNPNSLFMLDGIGYLLTLLGEWEHGTDLIKKVIQFNPYYGLYVHYALWVDWMRQEEFEKAYQETFNFKRPAVFWEPLMKSSSLGFIGKYKEGKKSVEKLLKLKPDFPTQGRTLIKHYIKFDDIVDRTIEGLRKVELDIE